MKNVRRRQRKQMWKQLTSVRDSLKGWKRTWRVWPHVTLKFVLCCHLLSHMRPDASTCPYLKMCPVIHHYCYYFFTYLSISGHICNSLYWIYFYPRIYTSNTSNTLIIIYTDCGLCSHVVLNCCSVLFQMPVWTTPVSMEALALSETGRFNVSVCQHTEETSVRPVSSFTILQWKLLQSRLSKKLGNW